MAEKRNGIVGKIGCKVHDMESKVASVITKDHSRYQPMHRTFGQRMADKLTVLAGSWTFICLFVGFLVAWVVLNFVAWSRHWDPYPFILLNLFLSCVAALQAPVILMSQNRQSERDHIKAERDYAVNRKAEREIEDIQKDLEQIKSLIKKIGK